MTDDLKTEAIEHAVRAGRDPRWRLFVRVALALFAAAVLVMLGLYVRLNVTASFLRGQVDVLTTRQDAAAHDAQQLYAQVRQLGAKPVVSPPAPVAGPAGPVGPAGPGPSQQQIDAAVASYFQRNPPGPTPAMIAVQVAAYLTAHPPAPGQPPSQAQIATAASDYISAHAADFRGAPGATGQPGPSGAAGVPGQDATDAQVASAVSAYCSAHGGCVGPAGATGATGAAGAQGVQGISVTDLQFQRTNGQCQVVITLHDPATDSDTTITHPAGAAACPLPLLGNGN